MMKSKSLAVLLLLTVIGLNAQSDSGTLRSLKIMSKNVLYSSLDRYSVPALAENIKEADIVGCQELNALTARKIARMTGYYYCIQEGLRVIFSKYPIVAKAPKREGVLIELDGGQRIWVFNLHLPSSNYGPYELNAVGGWFSAQTVDPSDQAAVSALEETQRVKRIDGKEGRRFLNSLAGADTGDLPVFVTGDFNEPSHLDWTPAMVEAGWFPAVVNWPASLRMIELGFGDAFRSLNPDPVAVPGFTWTCDPEQQTNTNTTGETIREPFDRIDFVYFRGEGINPASATIFGPAGDERADEHRDHFVSDHRTLMVEFVLP